MLTMSYHRILNAARALRPWMSLLLALGCSQEEATDKVVGKSTEQEPSPTRTPARTEPSAQDSGADELHTITTDAADSGNDRCWFEYLGEGNVCENAGMHESFEMNASTAQDCAVACLDDPTCNAITDYTWMGLGKAHEPCSLHIYTCDSPANDGYSFVFSGMKQYRKVCGSNPPPDAITEFPAVDGTVVDPDSGCVFKVLNERQCEADADGGSMQVTGAATLADCMEQCNGAADCTAVAQWPFGSPEGLACTLHFGSCTGDALPTSEAQYFKKYCDSASPIIDGGK
jgi:hypothetical protein